MPPQFFPTARRVLMTADTVGGVWTYALELARALKPDGIEFIIATMGARLTTEQVRESGSLSNVKICESDFKLEWMESPWQDVERAGHWLLELADQHHPDIIHLNGYSHAALNWPAPVLVVAHSCVLSWWEAVKQESAPQSRQRYRERATRGLRAADLVIAPSCAMLDAVQKLYGPLRATEMIYNARDATQFRPGTKENVVATAGRFWDEAKNLAALAAVADELPWPVHVAGETQSFHAAKRLPSNIHLLGRLSAGELARLFSRAAIYTLPALYEPFGLSVLEAGLSGCALVLGDIPSLREIWGDAALFVPPRDHAALKSALLSLMCDDALVKKMASRSRSRALQFTPHRMAERYLSAYARLRECAANRDQDLVVCES